MPKKQMAPLDYNRVKEKLRTQSPSQVKQTEEYSLGTIYNVKNTQSWNDYRAYVSNQARNSYAQRKGIPVKNGHSIPTLGNGFRFNPSNKPLDGTGRGPVGSVGSPFDKTVKTGSIYTKSNDQNGEVITVQSATRPSEQIEVTSGAQGEFKVAADRDASNHRYNKSLRVAKDGVNAWSAVNYRALCNAVKGRKPPVFDSSTMADLIKMARDGRSNKAMTDYVVERGYSRMTINDLICSIAFDATGLADFKMAYTAGNPIRIQNAEAGRMRGVENARKAKLEKREQKKITATFADKKGQLYEETFAKTTHNYASASREPDSETTVHEVGTAEPEIVVDKHTIELEVPKTDEIICTALDNRKFEGKIKWVSNSRIKTFQLFLGAQIAVYAMEIAFGLGMVWWQLLIPFWAYLAVEVLTCTVVGFMTIWVFDVETRRLLWKKKKSTQQGE